MRVLLADDHEILRDGLRLLIQKQPDMEVVGEAKDGREALRLVSDLAPDVVVMDIGMPELNGIDATSRMTEERPQIKIVALSVHSDKRMVVRMLQAGALAYVPKVSASEELITALNEVEQGNYYLSPKVAGPVLNHYVRHTIEDRPAELHGLTSREREVLQLVVEGQTSKQIAHQLQVSDKTVEKHRQNIMKKLDLHDIPALTKFAVREGLTSIDG